MATKGMDTVTPDTSPMIQVENVGKTFRSRDKSEVVALEGCSMELDHGEFVCIVGPSGCGKTTLLRIIAGLIERTSGSVRIRGEEVIDSSQDMAMVFQKPVLLPWRTNFENILLPMEFRGRVNKGTRNRAKELLELVGLEAFGDKYPYELSGGMQQRVAISRALISDPEILLMDEPFGALDAMTRDAMNFELLRIWREAERTVVFVTHSIQEAIFLSDRVVVMSRGPGRVVEALNIDLPRPRTKAHRYSPEFGEYETYISRLIGVDVGVG